MQFVQQLKRKWNFSDQLEKLNKYSIKIQIKKSSQNATTFLCAPDGAHNYSTVTDLARFLGWSGFNPFPIEV